MTYRNYLKENNIKKVYDKGRASYAYVLVGTPQVDPDSSVTEAVTQ